MRPKKVYYKYAYYLKKFATLKRLNNIALNHLELRQKKVILKSKPYKITIDPGNFCNLRCPGCHTGVKHPEMLDQCFMNSSDYQTVLNQLKDYALSVALYNWGEPFLNKQIFSMIEYTRSVNMGTTLHSNFNVFNESMAENSVKAGLTHIYVSADGMSQEAYEKYRVRGHIQTVIENMKMLLEVRKRYNSVFPLITWKFLRFEHNRHEVEAAKELARTIGVDAFEVFNGYPKLTDIYDQADEYKTNPIKKLSPAICKSLWSSIYVHSDASVLPCSLAFRESEVFGNLLKQDLDTVWNNTSFCAARSMFSSAKESKDLPIPCKNCKYYLSSQCGRFQPSSDLAEV